MRWLFDNQAKGGLSVTVTSPCIALNLQVLKTTITEVKTVIPYETKWGNSPDKLHHPRSDAYSAQVILN